jgi:hypothetical protein
MVLLLLKYLLHPDEYVRRINNTMSIPRIKGRRDKLLSWQGFDISIYIISAINGGAFSRRKILVFPEAFE